MIKLLESSVFLLQKLTTHRSDSLLAQHEELSWLFNILELLAVKVRYLDVDILVIPAHKPYHSAVIVDMPLVTLQYDKWLSNPYLLIPLPEEKLHGCSVTVYRAFLACWLAYRLVGRCCGFSLYCVAGGVEAHERLAKHLASQKSLLKIGIVYPSAGKLYHFLPFMQRYYMGMGYKERQYFWQRSVCYRQHHSCIIRGPGVYSPHNEAISLMELTDCLFYLPVWLHC